LRKRGGKTSQRRLLSKELFLLIKEHADLLGCTTGMNRMNSSSKLNDSKEGAAGSAFSYNSTKVEDGLSSKTPESSALQAASKVFSEPQEQESCSDEFRAQSGARTQIRRKRLCSSVTAPSDDARASSPFQDALSIQQSRCENADGALMDWNLEFSELEKWVQDELIPYGVKVSNEAIQSAISSAKRHNLDSSPPPILLDDDRSESRKVSEGFTQISASFQNLRSQFCFSMKKICREISDTLPLVRH
jgi:hypothetical protein